MAPGNPCALSNALLAYAFRDADPGRALKALHRSLVTARDNGNSLNESRVAVIVSRLEAEYGDPPAAFEQSPWPSPTSTTRATPAVSSLLAVLPPFHP